MFLGFKERKSDETTIQVEVIKSHRVQQPIVGTKCAFSMVPAIVGSYIISESLPQIIWYQLFLTSMLYMALTAIFDSGS